MDKYKILQSAPIDIEISPRLKYAGTERIIDALNRAYHDKGNISYVAASGDSDLGGKGVLIPTIPKSLWATENGGLERKMVRSEDAYTNHYETVLRKAKELGIDVIHDHPGQFLVSNDAYLSKKNFDVPIVTTIHEDIIEEKNWKYKLFNDLKKEGKPVYFLGISQSHANKYKNFANLELDGFVYNGIPLEIFPFKEKKQDYLFWIGRISEIKGTDVAVEVARKTGRPLIIAGEVHTPFKKFYDEKVKPHITKHLSGDYDAQEAERNNLVDKLNNGEIIAKPGEILYVGPVDDRQKSILYQNASAVMVPNRWEEPFGLIMVEGGATGTPSLGTNRGAIPELIKDGKTGYVMDLPYLKNGEVDLDKLVEDFSFAVDNLSNISPAECRRNVEDNFSKEAMSQGYLDFYKKILSK